ncbi:MAG TPA: MBL fold metallo-hydrolase [Terriglobales bacterium]|nr:MBL fold metallo-hydrolase [Terriglobales bacterium]
MSDNSSSRRDFLRSATAAAMVPLVSTASSESTARSQFSTSEGLARISENLFFLADTCNVYLIRNGDHGILIDFGSGKILDHLAEVGVSKIDYILHTHHHRDQAQGDLLAHDRGIPIAVPAHERHLFEDAERFWANRRVFDLYQVRNDFFSLAFDVPVSKLLHDYETFDWRGHSIFVQPTPGHTIGSISLVAKIDGQQCVFSGDLIYSNGKVQNLYDLQYYYQEHEGVDFSMYSITELLALRPTLLCPSHGKPIGEPISAMESLRAKLLDWYHYWKPTGTPTFQFKATQISPHLISHPLPTSTFYAILSKSGKAMLIDYGSASWNFFASFRDATDTYGRMRFVEHSLNALQSQYGVKDFDVVIPTHIHDDHINGISHLSRRFKTRVWCYENMVEIFRNPRGRNLGCILAEPISVDRTFRDGEKFQWEEYELTMFHSPGHTEYQMALFTSIDGEDIAFTGDAFFNYDKSNRMTHNLIYRNDVKIGDYLRSIKNIQRMRPNMIAPGHGEPFMVTDQMVQGFVKNVQRQDEILAGLIANQVTDFGLDPSWVQIYPYQAVATADEPCSLEIRVRNHGPEPMKLQIALSLPQGWMSTPSQFELQVAPRSLGKQAVQIRIPRSVYQLGHRRAIVADVLANGVHLGQIAEAVVDMCDPTSPRVTL